MTDYEKLGVFYLGQAYDLRARQREDALLLYRAKDLVTHAVCVGMTGSGKTGLCVGLLEEAAIDGIPALIIDPKGDLGNLLLTFPALRPEDFRPWINEEEARTRGMDPDAFAADEAARWARGLAEWHQDGARIQRLRDSAEMAIYTPGSEAGIPVSIVKSFAAPEATLRQDRELLREQIATTVTSLLGLVGVHADPVQSPDHVLLSAILDQAWSAGQDLDLGSLILHVQRPPFPRIGVMDIESFYPAKDRFALALKLNSLMASPGFEGWLHGEPLEIQRFLYTPEGKPRLAIFSIAHLGDAERMFFVALLLNQLLNWVRKQSGTTSLRALLYMDEIFGYFPPVQNPPAKKPLLTLLKQARAFGVGVVLATQNPVDLDYKGLANCGTWLIGRLQTEQDKARVLDGLQGAASEAGQEFSRREMDTLLSSLGSRVFLLHSVHEQAPAVFQTRWTLSYLRGPLARQEIRRLMEGRKPAAGQAETAPARKPLGKASTGPPVLPPGIQAHFLPAATSTVIYRPVLIGAARMHFLDAKAAVDQVRDAVFLTTFEDGPVPVNWDQADEARVALEDLATQPVPDAEFEELPPAAALPKMYAAWAKDFADWLYRSQTLTLYRNAATGLTSAAGESEGAFKVRVLQALREKRDGQAETLRRKYEPKLRALEERRRRAAQALEREKAQSRQAGLQAMLSVGSTLLGAFLGRKAASSATLPRAAGAARSIGRTMRESGDIGRAQENIGAIDDQIAALNAQFEADVAALHTDGAEALETIAIRLKKTNLSVRLVGLGWMP